MELIMTRGVSGSGKSTWARNYVLSHPRVKRINRDTLRLMIDGGWGQKKERQIVEVRNLLIRKFLKDDFSVIVDDTNLTKSHEDQLRHIARECGASFRIQDFTDVPYETCVKRDLERLDSVGERVIWKQWSTLQMPTWTQKANCLPVVISDLDGTLANLNGRNPYDTSTCGQDLPRHEVFSAVNGVANHNKARIIILSGRKDTHKAETVAWLESNFISNRTVNLYMRAESDNRPDTVIKKEMFDKHIEGVFDPIAVFDDRPCMVRMWRGMGLNVFDVGNGVEF